MDRDSDRQVPALTEWRGATKDRRWMDELSVDELKKDLINAYDSIDMLWDFWKTLKDKLKKAEQEKQAAVDRAVEKMRIGWDHDRARWGITRNIGWPKEFVVNTFGEHAVKKLCYGNQGKVDEDPPPPRPEGAGSAKARRHHRNRKNRQAKKAARRAEAEGEEHKVADGQEARAGGDEAPVAPQPQEVEGTTDALTEDAGSQGQPEAATHGDTVRPPDEGEGAQPQSERPEEAMATVGERADGTSTLWSADEDEWQHLCATAPRRVPAPQETWEGREPNVGGQGAGDGSFRPAVVVTEGGFQATAQVPTATAGWLCAPSLGGCGTYNFDTAVCSNPRCRDGGPATHFPAGPSTPFDTFAPQCDSHSVPHYDGRSAPQYDGCGAAWSAVTASGEHDNVMAAGFPQNSACPLPHRQDHAPEWTPSQLELPMHLVVTTDRQEQMHFGTPAQNDLTHAAAPSDESAQRVAFGTALHPRVAAICPSRADKITGMLLEFNADYWNQLLADPTLLELEVRECMRVLSVAEHGLAQSGGSTPAAAQRPAATQGRRYIPPCERRRTTL